MRKFFQTVIDNKNVLFQEKVHLHTWDRINYDRPELNSIRKCLCVCLQIYQQPFLKKLVKFKINSQNGTFSYISATRLAQM